MLTVADAEAVESIAVTVTEPPEGTLVGAV
jgi:hypothetical protein